MIGVSADASPTPVLNYQPPIATGDGDQTEPNLAALLGVGVDATGVAIIDIRNTEAIRSAAVPPRRSVYSVTPSSSVVKTQAVDRSIR
ncbi:hypothetical protein ACNS7O_17440 (plasmid) [Haloferacaceae archaeon DSL9]